MNVDNTGWSTEYHLLGDHPANSPFILKLQIILEQPDRPPVFENDQ